MTTGDRVPTTVDLDFSGARRPLTILARLPGVRYVPARTRVLSVISGSGANFIGEGKPIRVTAMDIDGIELLPLKAAGLVVVAEELVRSSAPSAEAMVHADVIGASVQCIDSALIDPGNTGTPGVTPASVTSGVVALVSRGRTFADINADYQDMLLQVAEAGSSMEFAAWVMSPRSLIFLSTLHDASGAIAYPGLSVKDGGTLMGLPVVTSSSLPGTGSPYSTLVALIDGSQIVVADDGVTDFAVTNSASLEVDDAPSNDASTGTGSSLVSLYQCSAIAVRVISQINWCLRRPYVSVLSGVAY